MEILRPVSAEKEVENLRRDRPARRLRAEVSTLGGVSFVRGEVFA